MSPEQTELSALLERYERPLVRYAQSIVGDVDNARDVVQETFIKWIELRSKATAQGEEDAKKTEAWLFTVCRNRSIDFQRRQSRIIPMDPLAYERRSEEPGPSAVLENEERAGAMSKLLKGLSENQQDVIRLKFQNNLSYKEIAEITELSVTNVGFLLHTGLKRLRTLLEEQPVGRFELPLHKIL